MSKNENSEECSLVASPFTACPDVSGFHVSRLTIKRVSNFARPKLPIADCRFTIAFCREVVYLLTAYSSKLEACSLQLEA
jgi:hypothetical protein